VFDNAVYRLSISLCSLEIFASRENMGLRTHNDLDRPRSRSKGRGQGQGHTTYLDQNRGLWPLIIVDWSRSRSRSKVKGHQVHLVTGQ